MIQEIQDISIIVAFIAGFLSFFAPCILPLIPAYISWLLGISSKEDFKEKKNRTKIFLYSLFLILGFSIIFIILGASASAFGKILAPYRLLAQKIGGLIIIFFGLEFVGFLKIFKNHKIELVKKLFSKLDHKTSSFLVGLTFAFAWVTCLSPILGSILVLSSFQKTLNQGVIFLIFYSLGLAVPFLFTALFLGFIIEKIEISIKITKWINLFSGTVLIIIGILFFTDYFYKIVIWFTILLK